jgi:hypothetical protein
VYFPNASTGYASGDFGTILKTVDGGMNWFVVLNESYSNLYGISFTDSITGYAVNDYGTILKTNDGSKTWTSLNVSSSELTSVFFPDNNTGYMVGGIGIILKTINRGKTWSSLSSGTVNNLYSVFFTDANTGYAVGAGGTILKTTNGGAMFSGDPIEPPSLFKLYPNPAYDKITISKDKSLPWETIVTIFNANGGQILTKNFRNQVNMEMDISMLPKGIYLVKIRSNSVTEVKKLEIK